MLRFKNLNEAPATSETTVEHCTASISPSQQFEENSMEELAGFIYNMTVEKEICDVNYQQNVVGISTQSTFTEDMIPDPDEMLDT